MRVCETCKYRGAMPPELEELARDMSRLFPRVFYCSKLQVIRVYDPGSPARVFDCEFHEPSA